MAIVPCKSYYFKDAYFTPIKMANGEVPFISTDTMEFDMVNFSGVNKDRIMFSIKQSEYPQLYERVAYLENAIELYIQNMSDEQYNALPPICKFHFDMTQNIVDANRVRPNYWKHKTDDDSVMYLKGNVQNIRFYDWSGAKISPDMLGQGQYQFVIRANLVYFGKHMDDTCIANLQLRISQIRYKPLQKLIDSTNEPIKEPTWNFKRNDRALLPKPAAAKRTKKQVAPPNSDAETTMDE